jgi:uncharacterized protein with PIN domain
MITATFRFYEELNDHLPPAMRRRDVLRACVAGESAARAIDAFGVPLAAVELILVNGESAGLERVLREGDRVAVYPMFEAFDVTPLLRLRERSLRNTRFVADAPLERLARLLRLAGFDTLREPAWNHEAIARVAARDRRIVLTRDAALFARAGLTHACFVEAAKPARQFGECVERLDLASGVRILTRCVDCNGLLRKIGKDVAQPRVAAQVYARRDRFVQCECCGRVAWLGTQSERMLRFAAATSRRFSRGQCPG